jgi:hypothetical protein
VSVALYTLPKPPEPNSLPSFRSSCRGHRGTGGHRGTHRCDWQGNTSHTGGEGGNRLH